MARKPNYQFERSERERLKANKAAQKREQRERERAAPAADPAGLPDDTANET
ncbi:MAG TPA: hypothetical protein VJP88_03340 [Caulobacteraceae bacterium]|nr:hypothetical protein [Caulobacteraceae bacterium]